MPTITILFAREILDSRGQPMVEVDLTLSDGSFGRAAVPSGASTGAREVVELRDGGQRYGGLGVETAISNVNIIIAAALIDQEFDQSSLDDKLNALDGTGNKAKLGGNAILAVSFAFARATAASAHLPLWQYFQNLANGNAPALPTPMFNIVNGGKHADSGLDFQEFMIVPQGLSAYPEQLRAGVEIYYELKKILQTRGFLTGVGDEGGYAPRLPDAETALDLMLAASKAAGYKAGEEIWLALDVAANSFYRDGQYELKNKNKIFTADELSDYYLTLTEKYPIVSIEDPFFEDDVNSFSSLVKKLSGKAMIVGDDLTTTNPQRITEAAAKKAATAVIIKPNQIGTVSETLDAVSAARAFGWKIIVSHRSGDSEDATIAHLAVGLSADYFKGGAPARGERTAKYNELLRISEKLMQQS